MNQESGQQVEDWNQDQRDMPFMVLKLKILLHFYHWQLGLLFLDTKSVDYSVKIYHAMAGLNIVLLSLIFNEWP